MTMHNISEEVLRNHRRLCAESERFVLAMTGRDAQEGDLVFDKVALPELVRNYQYEVNPWPVFVGGETLASFKRAAVSLPGLLRKVFDPDRSEFFRRVVDYYDLSSSQIERLVSVDVQSHLVTRSDSVLTADGIKTVEVNLGSKVGGWQTQLFDRAYRQLPGLGNGLRQCGDFRSHDTLETYLRYLIGSCHALPSFRAETVELLFVVDRLTRDLMVAVVRHLEAIATRLGVRVRFHIDEGVDGIAETRGALTYRGIELHGLLVTQTAQPSRIPWCVFEAYCEGRLVWPDNPVCDALNEKKLFESFFQAQPPASLDARDLELARSILPICIPLSQKTVMHGERELPIREYLERRQHDFVIKSSYSAQGRDVHVGRYTGREEWRDLLRAAIGSDKWTAQQYCESLEFLAYDKVRGGYATHRFVFGLFSFSESYGGSWVRMSEEGPASTGVINSARGAQEAIVYECGN